MRRRFLAVLLAASCGQSGSTGSGDMQPPAPIVQMVVDANRDGKVDATAASADVMYRDAWDATHGAVMLANVDDDDMDTKLDADDEVVNGAMDEADLARIALAAWPGAPAGTTGTITIAPATEVRLFAHGGDGSWAVVGSGDALALDQIQAGVELGIEAKGFAHPAEGTAAAWDGTVEITWAVADAMAKPLGSDKVKLHVAPLVLQSNMAIPDRSWVAYFDDPQDRPDSKPFVDGVQAGADAVKLPLTTIDPFDDRWLDQSSGADQWTQDIFEVGYTEMPSAEAGGRHWMYVVVRTPVPDRTAADYTQFAMLGPDFGWVWKHSDPYDRNDDESSLDSFGNLDSIPPYVNNGTSYPLGRVLMGGVPTRHVDDALRDFLDAQGGPQGKHFEIDTSWLLVGHVDEILSFVKDKGPRGWKLLMASPARGLQVLKDLVAKDAANGKLLLFAGLDFYDDNGNPVAAQVTVDALLADPKRMAENQLVQAKIDGVRMALAKEIGLTADEIIDIPVLFEGETYGNVTQYVAYSPGLVNLFHLDGTLLPPAAHGPVAGGMDALAADFEALTGALGDTTMWVEDWNLYHALDGEVHCGTNVARKPQAKAFWEVLQ